jgi:hypothetical protein
MTNRELETYDEVEHVNEPGKYGIITDITPVVFSDGKLGETYRVQWYADNSYSEHFRSSLEYICPLSEVI